MRKNCAEKGKKSTTNLRGESSSCSLGGVTGQGGEERSWSEGGRLRNMASDFGQKRDALAMRKRKSGEGKERASPGEIRYWRGGERPPVPYHSGKEKGDTKSPL